MKKKKKQVMNKALKDAITLARLKAKLRQYNNK